MTYFDRIIRRANIRLLTMSSGQYELKRQQEGDNRREKAGLELAVIDHYNATQRSVKTLSGGESFQASLSLALGLADEIQSYAGGIQMDCMFVDEGFGSLDEEALAQAMKALQQLTEGNRLVGIITVDDIVDIMEEETTEDMEKMAAIVPSDKPYMRTTVGETYKKRIPWLLLLMVSATFTGAIIASFEDALSVCAVLTVFIPMLMDTGGNAGGQASVTIIRGLSLGEITYRDVPKVVWKEIRVAILCGGTLAAANFAKLMLFDRVGLWVALTVCLTLVAAVLMAMVVGCLLPIGAKRIGFDPAVMASPFITTIVDALSLLVYFRFAAMLLGI